mgnify:CR=1 FL=1
MNSITSKLSIIILSLLASTFALAQVTQMTDNNVGNGLAVEENTDFAMPVDSENADLGQDGAPSVPQSYPTCKAEGTARCAECEGPGSYLIHPWCPSYLPQNPPIEPTCPTGDTCP